MAQQTAVEWLVKEISAVLGPIKTDAMQDMLLVDAINQAKQMEKEQIENAHLTGLIRPLEIEATKQAEQYYNETYGTGLQNETN